MFDAEFNKNVLKITVNPAGGKFAESLKFKYYPDIRSLKLIGYDFNSDDFGNTSSVSINFLSNSAIKTEKSKGKKAVTKTIKTKFAVIKYDNISENLLSSFYL